MDILQIDDGLRLRRYDGAADFALAWYQDGKTVRLTDNSDRLYDRKRLYDMYGWLNGRGELYFIEIKGENGFFPVGDVTLCKDDIPIVIGDARFRGRGVGGKVLAALIGRARSLGWKELFVREIYDFNEASKRLFTRAGFVPCGSTKCGTSYRLALKKRLSEMTLEELWRLFPIFLTEHDPVWAENFREEKSLLSSAAKGARISHIGSTALGIRAKPIVDILLETEGGIAEAERAAESCGYLRMNGDNRRVSMNKGYTENGFADKVYHLHIRRRGDNDELYFRDYLLEHADAAAEYENLKLRLWKEFEHDRDGYTAAKTETVKKYTAAAKELYKGRYD